MYDYRSKVRKISLSFHNFLQKLIVSLKKNYSKRIFNFIHRYIYIFIYEQKCTLERFGAIIHLFSSPLSLHDEMALTVKVKRLLLPPPRCASTVPQPWYRSNDNAKLSSFQNVSQRERWVLRFGGGKGRPVPPPISLLEFTEPRFLWSETATIGISTRPRSILVVIRHSRGNVGKFGGSVETVWRRITRKFFLYIFDTFWVESKLKSIFEDIF